MERRSHFLNPRWSTAVLDQCIEIEQRARGDADDQLVGVFAHGGKCSVRCGDCIPAGEKAPFRLGQLLFYRLRLKSQALADPIFQRIQQPGQRPVFSKIR